MGKAVIFCRVSTSTQDTESQKQKLIAFANADGFSDKDIIVIEQKESGFRERSERKGLQELDEFIKTGDVTDIYIWELSRLSRNYIDATVICDDFKRKGIQLHCQNPQFVLLDESRKNYDKMGQLCLSIFGTLANQEIVEKKERFRRGKELLAKQGRYSGGVIPYGYRIDRSQKNLIVIDEHEAEIVREIFNLYEQGRSMMSIAKEFRARGEYCKSARGSGRFTLSLVHQILTNEFLTGVEHLSKGASYPRSYPAIVTQEQFDACRRIARENNKVADKSRNIYYASRLITCTTCGRKFVATGSKGYYHCRDSYNGKKEYYGYISTERCSNRMCISINVVDSLLWRIAQNAEDIYVIEARDKEIEACNNEIEILNQKLTECDSSLKKNDEKMDRLTDLYIEGRLSAERFSEKENTQKKERSRLLREKTEIETRLQERMTKLQDLSNSSEVEAIIIDDYIKEHPPITNDEERSRLVHKHIKEVIIEQEIINWKFRNSSSPKDIFAKKITVKTNYIGDVEVFYINGERGENMFVQRNKCAGEDVLGLSVIPEYIPYRVEYLRRFFDKAKAKRRQKEKMMKN